MKTTNDAINVVYTILKGTGGVTVPVYKRTKPTNVDPDEYIVLTTLPINNGVMQKCTVNVNYYVKDIGPGIADTTKLASGTSAVVTLLGRFTGANNLGDFDRENVEFDSGLSRHFSNIRIVVKLIN